MAQEKLGRELATYRKNHHRLMERAGDFVVIRGETILGIYKTRQDAVTAGYMAYGHVPFLLRQIKADEAVHYFLSPVLMS